MSCGNEEMTPEEWIQGWRDIRAIMDSENGEESMPYLHELAKVLVWARARSGPVRDRFPSESAELLVWRQQTGLSAAFNARNK